MKCAQVSQAKGINMAPVWGFDKAEAIAAEATTASIGDFAHKGTAGIMGAILATFAMKKMVRPRTP